MCTSRRRPCASALALWFGIGAPSARLRDARRNQQHLLPPRQMQVPVDVQSTAQHLQSPNAPQICLAPARSLGVACIGGDVRAVMPCFPSWLRHPTAGPSTSTSLLRPHALDKLHVRFLHVLLCGLVVPTMHHASMEGRRFCVFAPGARTVPTTDPPPLHARHDHDRSIGPSFCEPPARMSLNKLCLRVVYAHASSNTTIFVPSSKHTSTRRP